MILAVHSYPFSYHIVIFLGLFVFIFGFLCLISMTLKEFVIHVIFFSLLIYSHYTKCVAYGYSPGETAEFHHIRIEIEILIYFLIFMYKTAK
jgi:hypothetical protein